MIIYVKYGIVYHYSGPAVLVINDQESMNESKSVNEEDILVYIFKINLKME